MLITRSTDERISKIEKKWKRTLSKSNLIHTWNNRHFPSEMCVLLNNIFDARKRQCCVMCDKSSWLVWNFNMVHFNFYVFKLAYNKMSVHSLHYEHSQSYTSFLKRRHYTSLKSSLFLQMYIVLIAQGKDSKLFWNVNAYFTKDMASCVHMYSRSRMKLKHQWSKYSTGKYTQFILVVKMTWWAMNWWN